MSGLKTVLIGFGDVAQGLGRDPKMATWFPFATHAQVLKEHPAFDWCAVVDPDPAARDTAETDWGITEVVGRADGLTNPEAFDVAVLATPPDTRAGAIAALPGLKAALVEKPLSRPGAGEGDVLAELAQARGLSILVNHWRRADRLFQELAAGDLRQRTGTPQIVFASYGNGLFNNGSHMLDFIRMLLGEPTSVRAAGIPEPCTGGPIAGDVQVGFALTLETGAMVNVAPLDFAHYREVGMDIWGTDGRLSLYQESLGIAFYPKAENRGLEGAFEIASDQPEMLTPTVGDALFRMYDNLADVAHGRAAPWSPLLSARRNEEILDLVLKSAEKRGRAFEIAQEPTNGEAP